MSKVIVVFGAGSGLGASVARRFGREAYRVALVARRLEPLALLAGQLAESDVEAETFTADLTQEADVLDVLAAIQDSLGRIDAIYYAPTTTDAFISATELSAGAMRPLMDLSFFSLVSVVQAVLPDMRERGAGAILGAVAGNAVEGLPYMSGAGIAHGAARNFLFSLHGELAPEGIHVGLVCISGVIKGSEYHQQVEAGTSDAPEGLDLPLVDPDEMAETLWQIGTGSGVREVVYPRQ